MLTAACTPEVRDHAGHRSAVTRTIATDQGARILLGARLYVWPHSAARRQVNEWKRSNPDAAARLEVIASEPHAIWFGDWMDDPRVEARAVVLDAAQVSALPVLVAYNIPGRDCGGLASGGARSGDAYRHWITALADGIGDQAAVVILEPDGTAETQCLRGRELDERYALLTDAVRALASKPRTLVYIDAGNAAWIPPEEMAGRLLRAGVADAEGFALNVSNFVSDSVTLVYGTKIAARIGGKHFIIDSGRNGLGPSPDGEWCNPPGRRLGRRPTTETGHSLVDAYLWVKPPGESDGECNGGPAAGEWWADYALGLIRRSSGRRQ